MAYKKEITLRPDFPTTWGNASIKNVIIGDNLLSFSYRKLPSNVEYIVKVTQPQWTVKLLIAPFKKVILNGKCVQAPGGYVILKEKESRVLISQ